MRRYRARDARTTRRARRHSFSLPVLASLTAATAALIAATAFMISESSADSVDRTPAKDGLSRTRERTLSLPQAAFGSDRRPGRRGGAVAPPKSGIYFGAWTSPNTGHTMRQREEQIARKYDIAHNYHDWNDAFPDAEDRSWARGGRILYIDWSSAIFGTSKMISWSRIARGREDRAIDAEAARIRRFGRPVLLSFSSEPEAAIGKQNGATVRNFAAAFRHIHNRFRADRVKNVAWVWSVMGSRDYYSYYAHGLYPGDAYVDWIAWDPYNWYTCHHAPWESFAETIGGFYKWLTQHGRSEKPFMLSEWGSRESDVDLSGKGQWFLNARTTLKSGRFPNLKALVYFDSNPPECHWAVDTTTNSLNGYTAMAADLFFNP
ncbi:MAG TPA: glycosyl hydrolase [Gemmatimonadaceae bacterium]|nr:glycosyl hydrolase [Gemmatimonadaceae bacterium]